MARTVKLALAVAIPLVVGGWAAFRPELLFVNTKVSEAAPSAADSTLVSKGSFTSYAHETKGDAQILRAGGKTILRLSNFTTSNGPDVHVYLLKGTDSNDVRDGQYLDLGVIKGTQGDQNYELPAGAESAGYGAVSIWCKRFSVNFGGASLQTEKPKTAFQPHGGYAQLASFGGEIKVTSGTFRPSEGKASGYAAIIERDGKRFLHLKNVKSSMPVTVFLVKSESAVAKTEVDKAEKVDLGTLKPGKEALLPISKSLDIWLWRSVSLRAKDGKQIGYADLRSDQEKNRGNLLA